VLDEQNSEMRDDVFEFLTCLGFIEICGDLLHSSGQIPERGGGIRRITHRTILASLS
jgi:hypothetical protein